MDWIQDPNGNQRSISLSGAAGTGKTTLLGIIRTTLLTENCRAFWTATTGKAAHRLAEMTGQAQTLHSALYWPPKDRPDHVEFDRVRPFPGFAGDVVVVDEASMITEDIRDILENEWIQNGARVLYVGDGYQLPPVGKDFSIFHETSGPKLGQVYRSDDDVLNAASHLRETGFIPTKSDGSYEFRIGGIRSAVGDYVAYPEDHALITWRNKVRMQANTIIRKARGRTLTQPEAGDVILYCKNGQNVLNGEIAVVDYVAPYGKIGPIKAYKLIDKTGEERLVSIDGRNEPMDGYMPAMERAEYKQFRSEARQEAIQHKRMTGEWGDYFPVPITWGYCLTAHKAQGSEFDRVTIYLTNWDTTSKPFKEMTKLPDGSMMSFAARWCYTALTRAKKHATIVVGG
jgi:exodeoxyribonuclease-5